ncbi:hypothetical protein QTH91_08290 [Variovorax dokdonensis]|uniref:Uncharacterized protein n=1 Tax=Variovorax dokdonensis TaxID=344883 RepID=A0ABT7N953_9BURK|nr:hypothetical protein [Variovorax dokdonensis]MDM0044474.1 hypothetical protein [Variovorax dokdonensis]
MNIYPTRSQAEGVARAFSKSASCTVVLYRTPDDKFVTARPSEEVKGQIDTVYRDGYVVPTLLASPNTTRGTL